MGIDSMTEHDATEMKIDEDEVNDIIQKTSLNAIHVGTDQNNFKILTILPATKDEIEQKLDIGDYTCYRKLKQLERTGLVSGLKEEGIITITEPGKYIMLLLHDIISKVSVNVKKELKTEGVEITQ